MTMRSKYAKWLSLLPTAWAEPLAFLLGGPMTTLCVLPDCHPNQFERKLAEVGVALWGSWRRAARVKGQRIEYVECFVKRVQARYCIYWINRWGLAWGYNDDELLYSFRMEA
jgi:hypothetical protein